MFSRDQIDQVRSTVDMVEVIREYVPSLKSSGRSVKGLCPFHSERTPSFHVHPEKGLFKCFGCGEAGDVIAFISKMEQLSFSEALEMLAGRAGITLKQERFQEKKEPEGIREKLYRALETASKIYEDQLWDERLGASARGYLDERGVREDTREKFHLGYAAQTGSGVFETLVQKGFSIELCQQAGLVSRSSAGRFYDPMFGRLIFPIYDTFGHVIGFGGRVLPQTKKHLLGGGSADEESGPKYLNSPETPVFSKGKSLYGLFQSKQNILASRRVIILEGYMDVVGVTQGGVQNAVATLGTAFTRDHAKVLKRYANEVTAFFDPDEAGAKAAMRSLEPMLQEEFFPRVVMTTETGDPDEIIRDKGKEFFDGLVDQAPDFLGYVLKTALASKEMTLQKKSEVAMQLLALIAQSPNEILKSEWMSRLASELGLRLESLEQQMKNRKLPTTQTPAKGAAPMGRPAQRRILSSAEEEFLQLIIVEPRLLANADVAAADFLEERFRRAFAGLREQIEKTNKVSLPALYDELPPEDKEWVLQLSLEEKEVLEPEERLVQLVRDIKLKKDKRHLQELSRRLAAGENQPDLQDEYKDLLRRVKGSPYAPQETWAAGDKS